MKPDFLNTILKEPDGFSKYVKFDKLSRPKIRELLPHYEEKKLVTTIFFEQRIKEKFNTRFDYYFWECCLLYFAVLNLFVVLSCFLY